MPVLASAVVYMPEFWLELILGASGRLKMYSSSEVGLVGHI